MKKRILLAVDITNEFTTGALGSEDAVAIIPAAAEVIAEYEAKGYDIVYLQDTHEDYFNTQEGRKLPVKHGEKGTFGWEIVREVRAAAKGEVTIILKQAFGSMRLVEYIKDTIEYPDEEIEEIVVIGLVTDICVISNVLLLKAAFPEVLITVIERACAGLRKEGHDAAIMVMRSCQANVI